MSAKPVSPNLAAPEILARLLGLHERLQSLTETSRIQATVIEILVAIPGVANAEFHSPSETQTHAPPHNGETTHEFPLRVGNWHKLDLLIHVSDPEQFAAYRPFMGNIAAIAAPHLAEHENAATQNRFQTLFEHSSQCIWLLSSEGIVLDVNPTALNCGNCAPVNVLGHRFSDGPWWQNQGVLTSTLNSGVSRAANGESVHFEVAIQGPSDTETLDLSLQPVMDPDGQVGMIIAEGRVITAMKAEERALEIQRKRLENIIDGTRVGTWEWNVQTGEVRFNSRWAEMLGYRLDELGPLGIGVWERLAHPDDLAAARLQLQSHFVGHIDHYDIEGRMRHRNGQWIWVQDRGRLISRTEEGAPLWMAGTHTDITERKNAELEREAAREETERLLEEAAESRRALLSILEDHRHTTEALKHSEAGLREAQRLAHMGSWRMDLNSKTLECSDEALQIFAIDRDAFQCDLDSIMNRIHPEDRAAVEIAYQDALDSHSTYEIFHRLLLPDGQIKYVHERGETEYDQHGKALHTSGTVQDVTELTRAEHALREINERSQLAGQLAYDLVYEWDATRDELHWHGDIDRLLGYPQGKLSQHMSEWLACIHPDDLPILKMSIDRHRRAAEAINIDYRVLHADGSYRHWNDRALPVLDGDGIPLRWVGVCSDITKRKLAEQALRRSEQQYRGVVEDTPVLICRFDPDGVLQFVNRAYGDYFNRRPEDLVGHNFLNLVPTQDRPEVLAKLRSLTPDAPTLIQEHRVVTGDGTMHWQRWTDRALFDRNGQVLAYQSTGEDITERKRHEAIAELQAKRAIAMLELPKFAESVDEREVLHQALHQMQSLTRSEIGFLYFVNNDQTSLRLAATSASTPISADESRPLKTPNAGLWADALRQRRPVIFNELLSESERRGLITSFTPITRLITTPVLDGNRVAAIIGVANKPDNYENIDLETVQLLATETWRMVQRHRAAQALEFSEARYRNLVERMSDGVVLYQPTGTPGSAGFADDFVVGEVNAAAERFIRRSRDQVIGMSAREAFPGIERIGLIAAMQTVARTGKAQELPERLYESWPLHMWVENYVFPLPTGEVVAIFSDITEHKQAEERRRLADRVFRDTIEGVMVTDAEGKLVSVNPAFTKITGYEEAEVLGKNPRILSSGRQDEHFYDELWRQVGEQGHWRGEIWNRRKNGEVYPQWLTISRIATDNSETTNYVGVFSDITNLKQAEERVEFLAHHDPLTELPNRTLFLDRLAHGLARAQRQQRSVHVMFIDLDRFKVVNDTLGHPVGDELLVEASRRMQSVLRAGDTIARVGGDEFLILLEDGATQKQVSVVARKLLEVLRNPMEIAGHSISVSASVGISTYPSDGDNGDLLMRHADRAMYEAKRLGRNTYRFFTPELAAGATELLILENDLRVAIDQNQLLLHYQPQIDMTSGELTGAEALLRWNHPRLGFVAPTEFIPIAEDIGIIQEIGAWVLKAACHQVTEWDKQGLKLPSIAVNLSTRQIGRTELVAWISSELHEAGLTPERLELEVTESQLMRDPEASREALTALQSMGVRVAIDDFGTGYSSLAYLKLLPLDHLKIDQSFVQDISVDANGEAIVRATIALANSLNLSTIAEGVENPAQADYLRQVGATQAQGYLISHPLPPDQFLSRYHEGRLTEYHPSAPADFSD